MKRSRIASIWEAIPCKLVLFLTAVALAVGEFYPFSDYPMYSQFKGEEYYLFLKDADDEPVPCKAFHTSAPKLKKRFKSKLKDLAKEEKVRERNVSAEGLARIGGETLESYRRSSEVKGTIKLIHVHIGYVDGEITKTEREIASVEM